MPQLYDWQVERLFNPCLKALQEKNIALLMACTGSGKTPISLMLSKTLGKPALICCPKTVITQWKRTADEWGIESIDAINIEKLRFGNTSYLLKKGRSFLWKLKAEKYMLIWDEGHNATGYQTQNADILMATRQVILRNGEAYKYELPTLIMSATLCDSPLRLRDAVGARMGLHNRSDGNSWAFEYGAFVQSIETKKGTRKFMAFPKKGKVRNLALDKLNKLLLPEFGASIKQREIPGFPESKVIPLIVDMNPKDLKELRGAYEKLQNKVNELEIKDAVNGTDNSVLAIRTHCKQMSELVKVPAFIQKANDEIEEGNSVIIFIYYDETMDALLDKLKKHNPAVIRGGQSVSVRDTEVQRFLQDKTRLCITKISAGGVGVELGDIHGDYPRVTLISPPDSAVVFSQALGRPWRLNCKSNVIQYILIAAGTVEEKIKANLDRLLENLEAIQDSDLNVT